MRLLGWIVMLGLLVLAAQTAILSVVRQAEPTRGLLIIELLFNPNGDWDKELYSVTPYGEIVQRLTYFRGYQDNLSLHGDWLYFTGYDGLHRVNVWDGWEASHEVVLPSTNDDYHYLVGWLPNSDTMLLTAHHGQTPNNTCGVATMRADGSDYRVVLKFEGLDSSQCWGMRTPNVRLSQDGRFVMLAVYTVGVQAVRWAALPADLAPINPHAAPVIAQDNGLYQPLADGTLKIITAWENLGRYYGTG